MPTFSMSENTGVLDSLRIIVYATREGRCKIFGKQNTEKKMYMLRILSFTNIDATYRCSKLKCLLE